MHVPRRRSLRHSACHRVACSAWGFGRIGEAEVWDEAQAWRMCFLPASAWNSLPWQVLKKPLSPSPRFLQTDRLPLEAAKSSPRAAERVRCAKQFPRSFRSAAVAASSRWLLVGGTRRPHTQPVIHGCRERPPRVISMTPVTEVLSAAGLS